MKPNFYLTTEAEAPTEPLKKRKKAQKEYQHGEGPTAATLYVFLKTTQRHIHAHIHTHTHTKVKKPELRGIKEAHPPEGLQSDQSRLSPHLG